MTQMNCDVDVSWSNSNSSSMYIIDVHPIYILNLTGDQVTTRI